MLPVFAVYSTFLQRCCDQLIHDIAIEPQHLVIGIDRAGIVGDDGETHQGIFDAAMLSMVPNLTLFAPANYDELRQMLRTALYEVKGPAALRYPRGAEPASLAGWQGDGGAYDMVGGPENRMLVVTYGRTFAAALEASRQRDGISVLKLNRLLPLPAEAVRAASAFESILFVEEGIRSGGIGMQFLSALEEAGYRGTAKLHAIDGFVPQSTVSSALHRLGLDSAGILNRLSRFGGEMSNFRKR